MAKKKKSSFDGLGGNSFGDDVDEGLGTKNSNNSAFNNLGGNSFGDDVDIGLGKQSQAPNLDSVKLPEGGFGGNNFQEDIEQGISKTPEQKKKSGSKNLIDEWTDAAGGGW